MVDPFTKAAHFIPLDDDRKTSSDLIPIYTRGYWRLHGTPLNIISDRDSRFNSETWKEFCAYANIKQRMSTAFYPQTDGQTERLNQVLETYLRTFCNYEMSNWKKLLTIAEFAWNNSKHSSTNKTPFFLNLGYHPAATNPIADEPSNPYSNMYEHQLGAI